MSIDVIGDFLTVIRNGIAVSKQSITVPHSRVKQELATILQEEGFIKNIEVLDGEGVKKDLQVWLKYDRGESVIHEIKRVSTPGRRNYAGVGKVKPVIGGLGISILTTSKGIMTDKRAKAMSVGGEVICTVW